jgi:hypothetical protein
MPNFKPLGPDAQSEIRETGGPVSYAICLAIIIGISGAMMWDRQVEIDPGAGLTPVPRDAITGTVFTPVKLRAPNRAWFGWDQLSGEGAANLQIGAPRITGIQYAHDLNDGELHVAFEAMPHELKDGSYLTCRTADNPDAFSTSLADMRQATLGGLPYLSVSGVDFAALDFSEITVLHSDPVLCEVRPH